MNMCINIYPKKLDKDANTISFKNIHVIHNSGYKKIKTMNK